MSDTISIPQTHTITIPDTLLTEVANNMLAMRYMSQHYPRLDRLGKANCDNAGDTLQAILELVDAQELAVRS